MNKRIAIFNDTRKAGLGGHATHLAFRGLPGVDIVALADSNDDGIDVRMAEVGAARRYRSCDEMLDNERPDIVVLCSRLPGDHLPAIEAAARCHCHVLCEKPMTASLREADRIVQLSDAHGINIAVAHLARHALSFRTAKRMIERGEIGRVLTCYGRGKEDHRGGGEDMMVLGTHILDAACFFLGAPESVSAHVRQGGRPLCASDRLPTSEPIGPTAGDEIFAHFVFPDGVNGIFESRRNQQHGSRMGITIVGTTGSLSIRYTGDDARALRVCRTPAPFEDEAHFERIMPTEDRSIPGAEPLDFTNNHYGHTYFYENNRFAAVDLLDAIRDNRRPAADARDARVALEMMYGVYASGISGERITLPQACRAHPLDNNF